MPRLGVQYDPDDPATTDAVIRASGGNFRLIERLTSQIGRLLQLNVAVLDVRGPNRSGMNVCRDVRSSMPDVVCLTDQLRR